MSNNKHNRMTVFANIKLVAGLIRGDMSATAWTKAL